MDLKQFLKENPIIKQAELARLMYENKPHSTTKLGNKLSEVNGQRITNDDLKSAVQILENLDINVSELKKSII